MFRLFYIGLIRLHPRPFRQRFGDEMLWIFDQMAARGSGRLFADAFVSLWRQWVLRPQSFETAAASKAAPDGVPMFYTGESFRPRASALIHGAIFTIATFSLLCYLASRRINPDFVIGSHHPSRSHLLPAKTDAVPENDLPAEVKVRPEPEEVPVSAYFRLILVLGALDVNRDGVISRAEIANAPAALIRLDLDGDGKLNAQECGLSRGRAASANDIEKTIARFDTNLDGKLQRSELPRSMRGLFELGYGGRDGALTRAGLKRLASAENDARAEAKLDPEFVKQARLRFMRFHPVLAALDADHDGEISAGEIRNAAAALRTLDKNHDGALVEGELLPTSGRLLLPLH